MARSTARWGGGFAACAGRINSITFFGYEVTDLGKHGRDSDKHNMTITIQLFFNRLCGCSHRVLVVYHDRLDVLDATRTKLYAPCAGPRVEFLTGRSTRILGERHGAKSRSAPTLTDATGLARGATSVAWPTTSEKCDTRKSTIWLVNSWSLPEVFAKHPLRAPCRSHHNDKDGDIAR